MSDPKKIVIKINRTTVPKKITSSSPAADQITQWNIKRIMGALIVVLLVIVLPYCYLDNGHQNSVDDFEEVNDGPDKESLNVGDDHQVLSGDKTAQEKSIADRESENNIKPSTKLSAKVSIPPSKDVADGTVEMSIIHQKVTRALLARSVDDKEPIGEIKTTVRVKNDKATGVFYFTEIKDMKGRIFYHQWFHEGRLVYKRPIRIRGNRWRVSTSKLFNPSRKGNWTVRLIDKEGNIYNEINFKVNTE